MTTKEHSRQVRGQVMEKFKAGFDSNTTGQTLEIVENLLTVQALLMPSGVWMLFFLQSIANIQIN